MSELAWIGEAQADIEQKGEWWWPRADECCKPAILREVVPAIPWALSYSTRECVVQAGGNVGIYPMFLAKQFGQVHTFEPDPTNFECLCRNLAGKAANIFVHNAALGSEEGLCDMVVVEANNCGAHKISTEDGEIPVMTIDGLDLKPSLIWLDIEGHEVEALKGAQKTLSVCSPTIILEVKGLGEDPTPWLEARGYTEQSRMGNDRLYQRV
jgi:FkbM family methyltransferase